MKMIIQRLLAISAVIVLSIVLNYATTQDIINAEAAQIGFQVLLLIYLIQLVVFLISFCFKDRTLLRPNRWNYLYQRHRIYVIPKTTLRHLRF